MRGLGLRARGIRAGYADEDVLHGVTIEVGRGAVVAIIGPNGSGKSTLLKAIYGLVRLRAGAVTAFKDDGDTIDMTGLAPHRVTALGLNMVPQLANVFPEMTVRENLEIGGLPIRHRLAERLYRGLQALPALAAVLAKRGAKLSPGPRQMRGVGPGPQAAPDVLLLEHPARGGCAAA